jgi:hypothetical protein
MILDTCTYEHAHLHRLNAAWQTRQIGCLGETTETMEMGGMHTVLGWVLVPQAVLHPWQQMATTGDDGKQSDDYERSNGDVWGESRRKKRSSSVHCA